MSVDFQADSLAQPQLSQRWKWTEGQTIGYLMQQAVENPHVLSLAAGLVDLETLPIDETRKALARLFADDSRAKRVLQYGTTAGSLHLREELVRYLARLEGTSPAELDLDPNRIVLTTGSQQLLSILGEVLLDPGDICLVASPTYFVFMGNLKGLGAEAVPVETDENGMCINALEQTLQRLEEEGRLDRVKLIYLVSYYENPTGLSLAEDRRAAVVELARRWSQKQRIFILEDAAYRELRYDGPELSSVWSHDDDRESVILAQTFSKSFSPGLRVGFGVLPECLVRPICDRKGNEDFGSANLNQHVLATVLSEGLYEEHVQILCDSYRRKRDTMLAAADRYFRDLEGVHWVHPHGGLYVWMSLPDRIETGFSSDLFKRATEVNEVMYVPGEPFYVDSMEVRPRNKMRLSFGVQSLDGIDEGMKRLANAVRHVIS